MIFFLQAPVFFYALFLQKSAVLVDELEALETPEWAANAILKREILTRRIVDPNCGTGVLAEAARRAGYDVIANDIFDWGYALQNFTHDFLSPAADHHFGRLIKDQTVFMNPPFKKTIDFVKKAKKLGARKVVVYQNIAWYASRGRREFWKKYRPSRIYLLADRGTCWRVDVPERKRKGTTTKIFAFFVFDGWTDHDPILHLIYKDGGAGC